ncbi:MAG TPA: winged helix DNA-binding domain-containing protein [Solirubrobacteraceae bacterium]|nr:winged helix DNA-binding domain-containing protein [Solirubrobacteraceae bacterium]
MARRVLTARELGRATLARQLLLAREDVPVVEALERVGGLQAQEPRPPFVGLWSRLAGFAAGDQLGPLRAGELVRGMLMRATLHLVSAADFAALRPALAPVMTAAMNGALRGRMDGLDLDEVLPAARELLSERPRTFEELRALLSERFPAANDRALGYAVRTQLPLAMVPGEERWGFPRAAAFALAAAAPPEAAPAEPLVRRHLGAFGPASAADVQEWSGLRGLKVVLGGMRDELEVFDDERGRELFDLHGAPRPPGDTPAPPRLLPEFDSLVLAHADRSRVIADEHRPLVVTKNLRVRATFLLDGAVAGTWSIERKGRTATLRLAPFGRLRKADERALTAEAEALLAFAEPDAGTHAVSRDD